MPVRDANTTAASTRWARGGSKPAESGGEFIGTLAVIVETKACLIGYATFHPCPTESAA